MPTHAAALAPPADTKTGRRSIIGLDRATLEAVLVDLGQPAYRARQLWQWIYHHGSDDFAAMTSLSKSLRGHLAERFVLDRPAIADHQVARDATQKWLLLLGDGHQVETVFIPEPDRGTLCVSSQVGCTLTCRFCHTGTQRLVRNLGAAEIVGQVMLARDVLADWPSAREDRRLTNVVLMGMGEPLFNYDNVATAVRIMIDGDGLAMSRRKVTLSTSGVVPLIERCGEELGVSLAVSLHATTNETRDRLMPINKKYPIEALMAACRAYSGLDNTRRITFEYVMLRGVNDSEDDASRLVRLIRDMPAKVNLIPFNPWPGAPFERSGDATIDCFAAILRAAGISAPVRTPRGEDILAACGQLKSASVRGGATADA